MKITATRHHPLNDPTRPFGDMNRLFDAFLGRADEENLAGFQPAVDVKESADELRLEFELAGIDPESVEVSLDNSMLTVRGERKFVEASEGETWHRVERNYGRFERSFHLPRNIDPESIVANFDKGVLSLALPKREEAKPRTIEIKSN